MMTNHDLTRIRRQMQQRIRVLLAQRRVAAAHYPAHRLSEPLSPAEPPSAEPTPEH